MSLDGYPLHRLNSGHIRAWLLSREVRRSMASFLAKTYKTGCAVLSPTLRAFATVDPRGVITALPPPHKRFQFHELANKPSARARECACRQFWDPETDGPWGARDRERERDIHHPHCQGRQVAAVAWKQALDSANARLLDGKTPQARPDEWSRAARELEGH